MVAHDGAEVAHVAHDAEVADVAHDGAEVADVAHDGAEVADVAHVAEVPAAYDPDDNPDLWEEHFLHAFDRWQNYQPQVSPMQYRETSSGTLEGLRSRLSFFAEVPSLMTLSGGVMAEYELHRNSGIPETLMEFVNWL